MKDRFTQDYLVWCQIVALKPKILCPSYTERQKLFWVELAELHQVPLKLKQLVTTDRKLLEYSLDKANVIALSEGIESSVIHRNYPFYPTFDIRKAGVQWTNPIEPVLMMYGAGKGYTTTLYGRELAEGSSYNKERLSDIIVHQITKIWHAYSGGAWFVSPVMMHTKHDLFKIAIRDGIEFYSCFSDSADKVWCGRCFKCLVVDLMYQIENVPSPIKMKASPKTIFSSTHYDSSIDKEFYNLLKKKLHG